MQNATSLSEDHSEGLLLAFSPYARRYQGTSSGTEPTEDDNCNNVSDRS